MAETMTPSSITDGQIDKAADAFRAILRKHRTEFESDATHWKDSQGRWCYFACVRGDVERHVYVGRRDVGWGVVWWFAGVRKFSDT